MPSIWKRLPANPRLLLRLVRALERIATALEGVQLAQFKAHGVSTATRDVADDTPDDDLLLYSTDRDTYALQQREHQRRTDGFTVSDPVTPPRH